MKIFSFLFFLIAFTSFSKYQSSTYSLGKGIFIKAPLIKEDKNFIFFDIGRILKLDKKNIKIEKKEKHFYYLLSNKKKSSGKNFVVKILTNRGIGEGVFINDNGYFLTSYNIIHLARTIVIKYNMKKQVFTTNKVKVIAISSNKKLALLKLENIKKNDFVKMTFLPLREKSPVFYKNKKIIGNVEKTSLILDNLRMLKISIGNNLIKEGSPIFSKEGFLSGIIILKGSTQKKIILSIPIREIIDFLVYRNSYTVNNENFTFYNLPK